MTRKSWQVDFEFARFNVVFEHSYWSGKKTILVDGRSVVQGGAGFALPFVESDTPFLLGDHQCFIRTTNNGFTYQYDLIVDGQSVKTGQPIGPHTPVPPWAYAFMACCGVLLFVGGALGALCALPGIIACRKFARDQADSLRMRVALCGGVTFLSWSGYFLVNVLLLLGLNSLGWNLGPLSANSSAPRDPQTLQGSGRVYLVPLGTFSQSSAEALARYYQEKYSLPVEVLSPLAVPSSARDAGRRQLIAEEVTALIGRSYSRQASEPNSVLIGLTDDDMFIRKANWRFAFSYRQNDRVAVVSSARMQLQVPPDDPIRPQVRLRKMVTKNIGTMHFDLPFSNDPRSVMYDSIGGLEELDAMGEDY